MSPTTTLNGAQVGEELASASSTAANLAAACQGILDTHLAPSPSHWYGPLNSELMGLQQVAQRWRTEHEQRLRTDVVGAVVRGGQEFRSARQPIDQLFAAAEADPGGAKAQLQARLAALEESVRSITRAVSTYGDGLRRWGQELRQAHDRMGGTIGRVQEEAAGLQSEIGALNAQLAAMQQEIVRGRDAIARARSQRDKGIVETIFGVLLAPVSFGASLVLAGVGVSSIAEAEAQVRRLEQTIAGYAGRIAAAQAGMTQDQAQVASLRGLTLSGGIALSDAESALRLLDVVRTTWVAFGQELAGVIAKLQKAEGAATIVVEKAWWNAASQQWDLVLAGAQPLLGAGVLKRAAPGDHPEAGRPQVRRITVAPPGFAAAG